MKKILIYLFTSLLLFSCIKENSDPIPESFTADVITLDEGNYMSSNSSMTGYDANTMTCTPDLFSAMAGEKVVMGDSPTSIYEYEGLCYVTISGSGKMYVFDPDTYTLLKTITGLSSPRYSYGIGSQLWVSDLYNTTLTKIDLDTYTVSGQVDIGGCAEMLIPYGGELFANFWNMDKRIARINIATGEVLETLEVGIQPYSMALDNINGILWVYCDGGGWDGNPIGFENPSIYKIDISSSTMSIVKKYEIPRGDSYIFKLAIGTDIAGNPIDDYIYFLNGDIYKMGRNSEEIPSTPIVNGVGHNFYSIAVSSEGEIYVADAGDYISNGTCYRYSNYGAKIDSFNTGISPGFIFIHTDYK